MLPSRQHFPYGIEPHHQFKLIPHNNTYYNMTNCHNQNQKPATSHQLTAAERGRVVVFNDLENLPIGLAVIWASALCVGFSTITAEPQGRDFRLNASLLVDVHIVLTVIFFAARVLHSFIYSSAGPSAWRTRAFTVGLAAAISLGVLGITAVFSV